MNRRPVSAPARSAAWRVLLRLGQVAGAVVAALFVAAMVSLAIWPPINDVSTGATPEYPDLQPQAYRFSQPRVLAGVREVAAEIERFEEVAADEGSGLVELEASTPRGLFVDDMTVRVEANGDGGAIVFVRSRSRVGRGDFGQNARNIEELFQGLDANLGVDRP